MFIYEMREVLYPIAFALIILSLVVGLIGVLLEKRKKTRCEDNKHVNKEENENVNEDDADDSFAEVTKNMFAHLGEDDPKGKEYMDEFIRRFEDRERQRTQHEEEVLARWGLTRETVESARYEANARNLIGVEYKTDTNAEFGSVDNPERVGMEGCSNDLRFSVERGHWVLTDGLGNGWIR
ncbi:MAG: hypothetical protein PUD72_01140 [Oscillospiraceae bacterium]|nr:hypothetical protein [Oscillospiraceae bacterium]